MLRRELLKRAALAVGGLQLASCARQRGQVVDAVRNAAGWPAQAPPPFRISLAQWSLNKTLFAKKLDNLDFPAYTRKEFGIDTVEFVDQFFADKSRDTAYLTELKKRCDGEGVRAGLIMIDTAGHLGDPDAARRAASVENHKGWLDAAKFLGCHTIRVNAHGDGGTPDEVRARIVESMSRLAEYGKQLDVNVVIENHGGNSSNPAWLAQVMKEVGSPWFGTLPDFGNFPPETDRYEAVRQLMPFARAVSAKTHELDITGKELSTDYPRMMKIVLDAGYRGYVGIECEGAKTPEEEPRDIKFTHTILQAIRATCPVPRPLWNGVDLAGWARVAGGEWAVENGALVARNGKDWSTDPTRTGSWLRTEKEYGDFELTLEYSIAREKSNSGIFFRSALEKNPAFTGYEVQIYDDPGSPPRKSGPGALYDVVAPSKNRVLKVGEWNQVRVIARGQSIRVHVNGEQVVDFTGDRATRGYIGLQNHDDRSEVHFRNLAIAEL